LNDSEIGAIWDLIASFYRFSKSSQQRLSTHLDDL
jgi:hypothetical protein